MRLYHRTEADHAKAILSEGFADSGDLLTRSIQPDGGAGYPKNRSPGKSAGGTQCSWQPGSSAHEAEGL